ncbi:MAG TPA: PadR family transcriptional regulator [Trebonia sp.]|jgi:PadR family transcriptional regulator AphA|nr:PadR family transcriptional regulator [Trebonia sp.]
MTTRQLTPFEHILLGLICLSPSSGYDLKRTFAVTPMGVYQPSSGTLYPALRRLEQHGLIRAQATDGDGDGSARRRRVYEPTVAGRAAHEDWLRTPVDPATVATDLGLHLMRFVLMEQVVSPDEVLEFLRSFADAMAAFTAQLEKYAGASDGGADGGAGHARLALEHGLAVHQASLRWARDTITALLTAP